jgi:hypothetical protein
MLILDLAIKVTKASFCPFWRSPVCAPNYRLKIAGREFTVEDLIEYEKRTCQPKTELTFKLIALSHYLESEETWENEHGTWSISRLINEELNQPVVGAACGGTHRMMGFSFAVRKRELRGELMDGQWLRAKKYVNTYVDYALELQNSNGSFSTNLFDGRGDYGDINDRMRTTGHMLEWLVYSLPREELGDPRIVRAVEFLTSLMLEHRENDWEIGPKGHAIHALAMYDEKVFGRQGTVSHLWER